MTSISESVQLPPLHAELQRLVRLRCVAGIAIIAGTVVNAGWAGWWEYHIRVIAVGGAVLAYNLPFWALLWQQTGLYTRRRVLLALGWAQLGLDLTCLTLLTMWTGGIGSPLIGLFVLHMVFASLLFPSRTSYVAAAAAVGMVAAGLWLTGQWPTARPEVLLALGWTATLLLTVYLTNHITNSLSRHERTLERENRRTQAILETAAEGIIMIDEQGVMTLANPSAERIFGYSAAEMIGRNVRMLMPEPDHGRHDRYVEDYRRTGQAKIIGIGREVTGRRKDGTTFPVDLAVSEVRLEGRTAFTGIVRDITDRKRTERELIDLNAQLRRQQQALVQHEKMSAMGRIAAGVAHEISNPLASMDSLLQLIKRQPQRLGPETVEVLGEQVDRISRIVRQMTDFAHPNETAWETAPLNDVVDRAIEIIRFDHRLKRVDLVCTLSPETGAVVAMANAIEQVLVNILLNAADALAGSEDPRIEVTTRRDGPWRIIEVADNGPGIEPENIGRVFDPFYTTKPIGHGTGLGLSISYSLVERHGGRCEVSSTVGEGAKFTVYLPSEPPAGFAGGLS